MEESLVLTRGGGIVICSETHWAEVRQCSMPLCTGVEQGLAAMKVDASLAVYVDLVTGYPRMSDST